MPSPIQPSFARDLLPWTFALLAGTAAAQTPAEQTKPPLPTKLQYVSPMRGYQAYADQPVSSWREANDRVGRIGGWRTYAKEVTTGEPAKEAPATNPHAGHHGGVKP